MALTRERIRARNKRGSFAMLPDAVLKHEDWLGLPPEAVKLVIDLAGQYNGRNNGSLCASWNCMQHRGWQSMSLLHKAIREAIKARVIMPTRHRRRGYRLYALMWEKIDRCGGKLDVRPTAAPPRSWVDPNLRKASRTKPPSSIGGIPDTAVSDVPALSLPSLTSPATDSLCPQSSAAVTTSFWHRCRAFLQRWGNAWSLAMGQIANKVGKVGA